MAGCDYYSCDVCSSKVYYDSDVEYGEEEENWGVGDMAVLCKACSEEYQIVIQIKEGQ
jgi:hypothetical protein